MSCAVASITCLGRSQGPPTRSMIVSAPSTPGSSAMACAETSPQCACFLRLHWTGQCQPDAARSLALRRRLLDELTTEGLTIEKVFVESGDATQ